MAESVAFLILLILLGIVFGLILSLAAKSFTFITRHTPLNILDSLGGWFIGATAGLLIIVIALLGIGWFSPITYTPLGILSPQRVQHTVLLAALLDILPIAV